MPQTLRGSAPEKSREHSQVVRRLQPGATPAANTIHSPIHTTLAAVRLQTSSRHLRSLSLSLAHTDAPRYTVHVLPHDSYLQRLTSRLNHHRRLQQLSRWCRGTVWSLDSSAWPFELFLRLRWLLISPARAFMLPNHTHSVSLPPGSSSSTVAVTSFSDLPRPSLDSASHPAPWSVLPM